MVSKHKKVLVVSTSRKTRGGISEVIKLYESTPMWHKYHCYWIGTHIDKSRFLKLLYFVSGLIQTLLLSPFYDIVHIHYSLDTTARRKRYFFKIAKAYEKKIVTHLHCGTQIDDVWNKDYELLIEGADKAIFLSQCLQSKVEEHTGKSKKYAVVYNPCTSIKQYDGELRRKHILFAASLYEGKGYKDLLLSFAQIAGKYPDWKLVFAGNGEIENAKKISSQLGISNQTVFLGWISNEAKEKAFKEASIFCLPSYAEGFPMAVLDAFSYGIPVVTTPVGGIPDIAVNGENMLLFEPGDQLTLANQLEKLICNKQLYEKLHLESLKLAKTVFDPIVISNQIGEIYDSL